MVADEVEPLDHNRDDMRATVHTMRLLAWLAPGITESDLNTEHETLRRYLPINQPEDKVLTPKEAAARKRNQSNGSHTQPVD